MDLSREQPNGMNSTEEKKVIIRSWEGGEGREVNLGTRVLQERGEPGKV